MTRSVPDSFRTARLEAQRLAPHHLDALIALHRDPRVMAELGGVRDLEQTRDYLARNLRHWDEHGFGVWMLRERGGSEPIGRAILRYLELDGAREVEVGFALHARFQGRGLGTEAGEACCEIAWGDLAVDSLVGVTTPANAASQRVLEKIGLEHERDVVVEGDSYRLYRASRPMRLASSPVES